MSWCRTETAAQVHPRRALAPHNFAGKTLKKSDLTSRHCVLIKTRGGVLKKHREKREATEARLGSEKWSECESEEFEAFLSGNSISCVGGL